MQPLQLSPRYSEALPMYYRLQQTLIDKIICQDWKAGMQLPSEREIAATMGISVGTVRKALENMVHKGYLSRIQGKGTFVAENTLDRNNVKYYRLRKSLTDQDTSLRVRTIFRRRRTSRSSSRSAVCSWGRTARRSVPSS